VYRAVTRDDAIDAARAIRSRRYPGASVLFAAGSIVRGDATPHSDLDLVVICPSLTAAYRESFVFGRLPVEAFVHDPETVEYFFVDVDERSGKPSLPAMVHEGVEVPHATPLSAALKTRAAAILTAGPPPLTSDEDGQLRYAVTDLVDDIRSPRSDVELTASGARLYEELANYHLRATRQWSASRKAIPRALERADAALAARYARAFADLFERHDGSTVIALAEELLRPSGGFLFDGYRLQAPPEWRRRSPPPRV
jgi:hypothetical protein